MHIKNLKSEKEQPLVTRQSSVVSDSIQPIHTVSPRWPRCGCQRLHIDRRLPVESQFSVLYGTVSWTVPVCAQLSGLSLELEPYTTHYPRWCERSHCSAHAIEQAALLNSHCPDCAREDWKRIVGRHCCFDVSTSEEKKDLYVRRKSTRL
jgi:hypothetical protein